MGAWCSKSPGAATSPSQKPVKHPPSNTKPSPKDDIEEEEEDALGAQRFTNCRLGPAGSWLRELGLSQYADAFDCAGYSDWELLGLLDENDLQVIEMHGNLVILPGHRKKLLLASKQLASGKNGSTRPHRHAALDSNQARNAALSLLHLNRITPLQMVGRNSSGSRSVSTPVTPRNLSSSLSRDLLMLKDALPKDHMINITSHAIPRVNSYATQGSNSAVSSRVPSGILSNSQPIRQNSSNVDQQPHLSGGGGGQRMDGAYPMSAGGALAPCSSGWLEGQWDGSAAAAAPPAHASPKNTCGGGSLRTHRRNPQPSSPARLGRSSDGGAGAVAWQVSSPRSVGRMQASSSVYSPHPQRFSPSMPVPIPSPESAPNLMGAPLVHAGWQDEKGGPSCGRSALAAASPQLAVSHSSPMAGGVNRRWVAPIGYERTSSGRGRAAGVAVDGAAEDQDGIGASGGGGGGNVAVGAAESWGVCGQLQQRRSPDGSAAGAVVKTTGGGVWGGPGWRDEPEIYIPGQCLHPSPPPPLSARSPTTPLDNERLKPPTAPTTTINRSPDRKPTPPGTPPHLNPLPTIPHVPPHPTTSNQPASTRILGRSVSARALEDPSSASDIPRASHTRRALSPPPYSLATPLSNPSTPISTSSHAWAPKPPIPPPRPHSPANPISHAPALTKPQTPPDTSPPPDSLSITFSHNRLISASPYTLPNIQPSKPTTREVPGHPTSHQALEPNKMLRLPPSTAINNPEHPSTALHHSPHTNLQPTSTYLSPFAPLSQQQREDGSEHGVARSKGSDGNGRKALKSSPEGRALLLRVQAVLSELIKAPPFMAAGAGRPAGHADRSALSAPRPSGALRAMALQREELLLLHQELEHRIMMQKQRDGAHVLHSGGNAGVKPDGAREQGQQLGNNCAAVPAPMPAWSSRPPSFDIQRGHSGCGLEGGLQPPSAITAMDPSAALADVERQILMKLEQLSALQDNGGAPSVAGVSHTQQSTCAASEAHWVQDARECGRVCPDLQPACSGAESAGSGKRPVLAPTSAGGDHDKGSIQGAGPSTATELPPMVLAVVGSRKHSKSTQGARDKAAGVPPASTHTVDQGPAQAAVSPLGAGALGARNPWVGGVQSKESKVADGMQVDISAELLGIEHRIGHRIQALHNDVWSPTHKHGF